MQNKPILSVVTPTLGKFSDYWLEQLLKVNGSVEFVLVYPPGVAPKEINDPRVKVLTSPFKGEMMQRFIALLNTTGEYVLALDDDDFVHFDIITLIKDYFQRFPNSWVLRLKKAVIDFREEQKIREPWPAIPNVDALEICRKTPENPYPYQQGNYQGLLEVPVCPLDKKFDLRIVLWPLTQRKDNNGYHFENFNNIIWKNELVKQGLPELSKATQILGALRWIPSSGFDRLMGLFLQAKFFQKEAIIGHWMPYPEQIRYINKPAVLKPPRFHVISDAVLVKYFPRYGYLWNLFFSKLYDVPKAVGKTIKWQLTHR